MSTVCLQLGYSMAGDQTHNVSSKTYCCSASGVSFIININLKIILYCSLFTDDEIKYFKTIKFHHIITNATKLEGSNFQEDVFKWSPGIWFKYCLFYV